MAGLREGDRLLEIGAGTGQIGVQLLRHRLRYVAVDVSSRMLGVFRAKLLREATPTGLVRADAAVTWPLEAGSVRAVFGSRSLHRLEPAHVACEALRVADPEGALLLIGRVRREATSIRSRMREEMQRRLSASRIEARSGELDTDKLLGACRALGALLIPPRSVARWRVRESPLFSLESWRSSSGLGGWDVAEERKLEVLEGLASWAGKTFGRLDVESESEDTYILEGARLIGTAENPAT